ncbi:MAG: bifunctional chorismate mutase/prephenate dehydratase [Ruminococcaceae bacterium]|nr:bifunctional chorismate mutase/prephenate dehydratase [Oscillospiraceae bacterium]
MDRLEQAREVINRVDAEMARLFEERLLAAREIAAYKKEHGLPILDAAREAAVVARGAACIKDESLKEYYVTFQKGLMAVCRDYQSLLLEGTRIAYSGTEGAFAHTATKRIFPEGEAVGYPDFVSAYRAVENGECYAAVLPIENSFAGEVAQVTDLLFSGTLSVSGMYDLAVTQNLLTLPGADASAVKTVISHPQALSQCEAYIRKRGFATRVAENTALAAKLVSELGDPTVAAIGAEENATLYHLSVADHAINESAGNTTRFAVFTRARHPLPSDAGAAGRFILVFTVLNEAGSLAGALDIIGKFGFNLRTLRSRPLKGSMWKYYFYAEAEGNVDTTEGRAMLAALGQICDKLKVSGTYVESDASRLQ